MPRADASTAACRSQHLDVLSISSTLWPGNILAERTLENLALACWTCNLKKGPNLSGIDPQTGLVTPLFNPRKDPWDEHFMAVVGGLMPSGIAIVGVSAVGRRTVQVLAFNDEMRQMVRYELWREGMYVGMRFENLVERFSG